MKRLLFVTLVILFCAAISHAQGSDDYNFTIEDHETSFAVKVGGGLDVRASRRVDIRLIEVDYNPVFAGNRNPQSISGPFTTVSITGKTANNFTIGFGIVIH